MSEFKKTEVAKLLKDEKCQVVFTKKDGTKRTMNCTLKSDCLPKVTKLTEGKVERAENPDVLPVFDLDNDGWRSFRLDSLESIVVI